MKKLRWRRIIGLFIILILVIAGLWWGYSYFFRDSGEINGEKAFLKGQP